MTIIDVQEWDLREVECCCGHAEWLHNWAGEIESCRTEGCGCLAYQVDPPPEEPESPVCSWCRHDRGDHLLDGGCTRRYCGCEMWRRDSGA